MTLMSGSEVPSVLPTEVHYDALTVRIFPTAQSMAAAAAADIAGVVTAAVTERGTANAMFATGNSQLAMLADLVRIGNVPWDRVSILHMDEYLGLGDDHPASFRRYIRTRLAEVVHPLATFYVGQSAPDYAAVVRAHPLDLCVMGVGENGHLAFNDPPVADFDDPVAVKVVELDEACRRQQVGEAHFSSLDEVPTHAVTVTIPTLLSASAVVVVCPDTRKAPAVAAALTGPISAACPASVLRRYAHARLYLDAAAAALL
jgi:glucosamine-6-phosphate deaminase